MTGFPHYTWSDEHRTFHGPVPPLNPPLRFRTALVDFPWNNRGGGKIKRGADKHYNLVKDVRKDGSRIIYESGLWNFEDNAHAFFWTLDQFVVNGDCAYLMQELGFTPKRLFIWKKDQPSIGQYGRNQHEIIMFGVRGKGKDPSVYKPHRDIPSHFSWPTPRQNGKRIHSAKPPQAYVDLFQRRSFGPYVELFNIGGPLNNQWATWNPKPHR